MICMTRIDTKKDFAEDFVNIRNMFDELLSSFSTLGTHVGRNFIVPHRRSASLLVVKCLKVG